MTLCKSRVLNGVFDSSHTDFRQPDYEVSDERLCCCSNVKEDECGDKSNLLPSSDEQSGEAGESRQSWLIGVLDVSEWAFQIIFKYGKLPVNKT